MNGDQRFRRPALPRSQPIRNWSTLFGGPPGASPDGAAYAAPVGQATRVRLEVVTSRVVTVSVELAPEAATRPATAHALRSADQDKPRLTEVSLRPDAGGPAVLRVCVPDDQPAGVYSGLVVDDEASRLVGTINVRIGGSPDDERSRPTPP